MEMTQEFWASREPALVSHGFKPLSHLRRICGDAMFSLWFTVFPCRTRKF